jgi:hypothetical protein
MMPQPAAPHARHETTGFDALAEIDLLDRAQLATHTYSLLTELPSTWSVRVGLLGEWGSGKSTIAGWVIRQADQDGHIICQLRPWTSTSMGELWLTFAEALEGACRSRGVILELASKIKAARAVQKFTSPLQALSGIDNKAKALFGAIEGAANSFDLLRISKKDLTAIARTLGDRRVIVIIDDLDRTDPAVLPRSLLALRDLLDLPRFSFLLPFDEQVVAAALAAYSPAWGDGAAFIDKILDFRVRLSPPLSAARWSLFEAELKAACPFVPLGEIVEVAEHLPANPRRIKSVARNLRAFQREALRHRPDEIEWTGLVFALLLRSESETYYEEFLVLLFGTDEIPGWAFANSADHGKAEIEAKERALIDALPKPKQDWVERLCKAWRERVKGSTVEKLRYSLDLLSTSESVTWLEYDQVFAAWSANQATLGSALAALVRDGAPRLSVMTNTLHAAFSQYESSLKAAGMTFTAPDQEKALAKAAKELTFIDALLQDAADLEGGSEPARRAFGQLALVIARYGPLEQDPRDQVARDSELALMRRLYDSFAAERAAMAAFLADQIQDSSKFRAPAKRLVDLLAELGASPTEDVLTVFQKPGAFDDYRRGQEAKISQLVFDPRSPAWTPGIPNGMDAVLVQAAINPVVQQNLFVVLEDLAGMARTGPGSLGEAYEAMKAAPQALSRIWTAALDQPVQSLVWFKALMYRHNLILAGFDKEVFPEPAWVAQRLPLMTFEADEARILAMRNAAP